MCSYTFLMHWYQYYSIVLAGLCNVIILPQGMSKVTPYCALNCLLYSLLFAYNPTKQCIPLCKGKKF